MTQRTNKVITNTVGGELSPEMYDRIDLPLYQKGLAKLENFISIPQGGAKYRPGTKFSSFTAPDLQWGTATYITGTASVAKTGVVTGIGTTWTSIQSIPACLQIGFGSTDYTKISTWFPIQTITNNTSIALPLTFSAAIAAGPYVIQGKFAYAAGTASASGTGVTGASSAWTNLVQGATTLQIGFGSKNPAAITQWYPLASINSGTSITLQFSAGTVGSGNYVITQIPTWSGPAPGILIPFVFSDIQAYTIELTNQKFRFYKDGNLILYPAQTITGMSSFPVTNAVANHGYNTGDVVWLTGVVGPTRFNNEFYVITVTDASHFYLNDFFGNPMHFLPSDPDYVSGGTVAKVYELSVDVSGNAIPYTAADLAAMNVQWAQSADTLYIVSQKYKPRKLTRTGDNAWTFDFPTWTDGVTPGVTNSPFNGTNTDGDGNCPRAVTFVDTGRLIYAGTINNPSTFWGSQSPSANTAGVTAYDNFNLNATKPTPTSAYVFTLSPIHGQVDAIEWISNTSLYLAMGTYGSIRILYGNTTTDAISPIAITAKSVTNIGSATMLPVALGMTLLFIDRAQRNMHAIEYDFLQNWYATSNKTISAQHLTVPGFKQITYQHSVPDIIWCVRQDGRLIGLTWDKKEAIEAWHRHYLGGYSYANDGVLNNNARIISTAVIPRPAAVDQVWFLVKRVINNNIVYSVEYMSDWVDYPMLQDYYTNQPAGPLAVAQQTQDQTWYTNVAYEVQKNACHLDMASLYDGSATGATLSIDAVSQAPLLVLTSSASIFTAQNVGNEIRKAYLSDGSGGGRAAITQYVSATQVVASVLSAFDNYNTIGIGNWYLTANQITGLSYLNGATVKVVTDGGIHENVNVQNGTINLNWQAGKVWVGYGYTGTIMTLNFDPGSRQGSAQSKPRNVWQVVVNLVNTVGFSLGTTLYNVAKVVWREAADYLDRPPEPTNGNYRIPFGDSHTMLNKQIVIIQDEPLPCTVNGFDMYVNTSDDF